MTPVVFHDGRAGVRACHAQVAVAVAVAIALGWQLGKSDCHSHAPSATARWKYQTQWDVVYLHSRAMLLSLRSAQVPI